MSNGFAGPQDTPSMMRYKPSRDAHRLAMPVLVCIAEHDREVPGEVGRQIAEAAPKGELKRYPVAHFDFYQAPLRTKIVEDQIAFLRRRLMKSEPST